VEGRTRRLANIITIFCGLGAIGAVMHLGSGQPIRGAIELLVLALIMVSAQIMKKGSAVGWWVLTVLFSIAMARVVLHTIVEYKPDAGAYENIVLPLAIAALFCVLPLVLLFTDPPWKWP